MGPYARRVLPSERATVDLEQERVSVTFRNNMAFNGIMVADGT
jgi:hypothetical protein